MGSLAPMKPAQAHREAERAWLASLPKIELHLHLEGAIPHEALWQLVGKYGGDPDLPNLDALRRRFTYRDFAHFIDTWNRLEKIQCPAARLHLAQ